MIAPNIIIQVNSIMAASGVSVQAIQKQLGAKQLTYTAVRETSKQLVSQKSEDDEALGKKLDDLEQKWNEVRKLLTDRQQKLERGYEELGNKKIILYGNGSLLLCTLIFRAI